MALVNDWPDFATDHNFTTFLLFLRTTDDRVFFCFAVTTGLPCREVSEALDDSRDGAERLLTRCKNLRTGIK
jgi:hypothetical protein